MQLALKDDAKWLSKFKVDVTSNSAKLYNNGSQQVKVTVSLTPIKGQEITNEQMDRIWLFLIKDGNDYRDLGIDYGRAAYDPEWAKSNPAEPEDLFRVSTLKDPRFEYYAASGFAPQNLTESAPRSRDFYISTLAPGGERYRIYAGITKESGVEYATSTSRFNSYVELETISFPRKKREDFVLERVQAHEGYADHIAVDIDVYYLEFADRSLRIVEAIPYGPYENSFYYEDSVKSSDFFHLREQTPFECQYHYAFRPGIAKDFTYRNISVPLNTRQGAMNFVRLELIGPGYEVSLEQGPRGPNHWGVLDQYGNEHGIELTQKNSGNEVDFRMRYL
jgi:hypothetical protein